MWYQKMKRLGDKLQLMAEVLEHGTKEFKIDGKNYEARTLKKRFLPQLRDTIHCLKYLALANDKTEVKNFDYKPNTFKYTRTDYYAEQQAIAPAEKSKTIKLQGLEETKKEQGNVVDFMKAYQKREKEIQEEIRYMKDQKKEYKQDIGKTSQLDEKIARYTDYLQKEEKKAFEMFKKMVSEKADYTDQSYFAGTKMTHESEEKVAKAALAEAREKGIDPVFQAQGIRKKEETILRDQQFLKDAMGDYQRGIQASQKKEKEQSLGM
jgi:hypothetical protein